MTKRVDCGNTEVLQHYVVYEYKSPYYPFKGNRNQMITLGWKVHLTKSNNIPIKMP